MNRREAMVRIGSVLLIVPAGWVVNSCSSGGTSYTPPPPTEDSGTPTGSLTFTSTMVVGHTHDFTIDMTELTTPPSVGISRNTTVTSGHVHVVTLSAAELSQINSGATVSKETSVEASHTHTFEFKKA